MSAPAVVPFDDILRRRHLPIFDGIRAIALFLVVLGHAKVVHVPADLGVSMFFVISGFLITWLLVREQDATGEVSLRDFYIRRTFRIFPAYYAFLVFSLALDTVLGDHWSSWRIAANFGYFANYYNAVLGHPSNSTAHVWSLAVEEQFYLLWPLGFIALSRLGRVAMVRVLGAAVVVVLAWRTVAWTVLGLGDAYAYNAFEARLDMLAIGCGLAIASYRTGFAAGARRLAAHWWMPLPVLALLLTSRMGGPQWYRFGPGFTVDGLLIAVLFVQLMQLSEFRPWRFIDHKVLRWVGTISYPCYLYHVWGLSIAHKVHALSPWGQFWLGLAITIGFGAGSWYLLERPMLALRRRFSASVTPPLAPADRPAA